MKFVEANFIAVRQQAGLKFRKTKKTTKTTQ